MSKTHGTMFRLSGAMTSPSSTLAASAEIHDDDNRRIDETIARASALLQRAGEIEQSESRRTRVRRNHLRSVVVDPNVAEFTRRLSDEVVRITAPQAAARRFRMLVAGTDLTGLAWTDRTLLRLGHHAAGVVPRLVMPLVARRLRSEANGVIVFDREPGLRRHVQGRADDGMRSNINVLGEAILGHDEADARMTLVLRALRRPDVDYVSVKISSICSPISALAFDATVTAVSERLRTLYREAMSYSPAKFVNLDMEEFRDLDLTIAAFTSVLSEPEFAALHAGIVLQAYLPDSHEAARLLSEWALERHARSRGTIKVRVVKGANLAMETVEAELHGWNSAPYATKPEVDASYKSLLAFLLQHRYDECVRVGVASHNLFDVAWAIGIVEELRHRSAESRVDFEMLEGMAGAQAQAVREQVGTMLLYTPVVRPSDFTAAIAYLVRRLDENTAPQNFLRNLFDIAPDNEVFTTEVDRFSSAVRDRHIVKLESRRAMLPDQPANSEFRNEPDTDVAVAANRLAIERALASWRPPTSPVGPIVGGELRRTSTVDRVVLPASTFGSYAVELATTQLVEDTMAVAQTGGHAWAARPTTERVAIIDRVADVVSARRFEILATMAHDAGKTIGEGDPEVSEAIDFARYYARCASEMATRQNWQPQGTVVVAPPWNFPFAIPLGGVLAALAAGNAVILKPAPQTILTARLVAQCCWEAGVPADAMQFLPCPDDEVGQALITHELVDAVILTGGLPTAEMFHSWKPSLRLHAETSGKNAMVITASADMELAVKDLVKSAFGHAGQKCSAASLAIVEASVYDDPRFFVRLADATRSLRVGPGADVRTDIGPLIDPPSGNLLRALTTLEEGERWLVEPTCLSEDRRLWTPGIRVGVREGSWFHLHECFGPVLGILRAEDLDHAVRLQNATAYGLTAGLHSLDPDEIDVWTNSVEAGNLYVNRSTTGAIVQRQPFGGWKRSVVGPTAKAGGPRYVASLARWHDDGAISGAEVIASYGSWAARELFAEHDPSNLRSESNVLRFRPLSRGVAVRIAADVSSRQRMLVAAAASAVHARIVTSDQNESDDEFIAHLETMAVDRLRLLGHAPDDVRRAAHALGIAVDDAEVSSDPDIELPRFLREQSVTVTRHRHGHIVD
jgi:RHH-type transcriptional regulator, proline utilization regulon repressor / proline dehydrogenase / delta 1-pyrroline-5-carboxylate dehydrogenase